MIALSSTTPMLMQLDGLLTGIEYGPACGSAFGEAGRMVSRCGPCTLWTLQKFKPRLHVRVVVV